jgi:hypothetical protein
MREPSRPLREATARTVRASPIAGPWREAAGPAGLSVVVGLFLAFVGAFGTQAVPLLPRYGLFTVISLICAALVWGAVALTARMPALKGRPLARRWAIAAMLTPATALAVWGTVGVLLPGGPRLAAFPEYLATSFGMTVAMSALSWAVFRDRPSRPTAEAPATPRFLERLPPSLKGASLWAVEAEDHYVRVHTDRGSPLILLRLADAVAELEGIEGARVHRSWWVAKAAVEDATRRGAAVELKLKNGAVAPVSRSQVAGLRRAGWF